MPQLPNLKAVPGGTGADVQQDSELAMLRKTLRGVLGRDVLIVRGKRGEPEVTELDGSNLSEQDLQLITQYLFANEHDQSKHEMDFLLRGFPATIALTRANFQNTLIDPERLDELVKQYVKWKDTDTDQRNDLIAVELIEVQDEMLSATQDEIAQSLEEFDAAIDSVKNLLNESSIHSIEVFGKTLNINEVSLRRWQKEASEWLAQPEEERDNRAGLRLYVIQKQLLKLHEEPASEFTRINIEPNEMSQMLEETTKKKK